MKRAAQCLVALVLLWVVVRNVDFSSFTAAVGKLQASWLATAATLFLAVCALGVVKWRLLWRRATWWQMLSANFIAQFYSVALPGQMAGELVKTLRVGRRFSDTTNVAASVIVDRVTGLLGIVLVALCGAFLSANTAAVNVIAVLCVTATLALGGLFAATRPSTIVTVSSGVAKFGSRFAWLRRPSQMATNLLSAWASLASNPGAIVGAVLLGIICQTVSVLINFIIAAGVGVHVEFADWCWIFGVTSMALLLPITVAGIGVREATYAGLLRLFDVPIEDAVLISAVVFGITLIGVSIGGALELAHVSRTPRSVSR